MGQVLQEFVQSEYALMLCEYCNVGPTARGTVHGMFEEARVEGAA